MNPGPGKNNAPTEDRTCNLSHMECQEGKIDGINCAGCALSIYGKLLLPYLDFPVYTNLDTKVSRHRVRMNAGAFKCQENTFCYTPRIRHTRLVMVTDSNQNLNSGIAPNQVWSQTSHAWSSIDLSLLSTPAHPYLHPPALSTMPGRAKSQKAKKQINSILHDTWMAVAVERYQIERQKAKGLGLD